MLPVRPRRQDMQNVDFTRRGFLSGAAAGALMASGVLPARAATTVGFIYVGPRDDWGWNQAHAVAAKALKDSGIKVIEEENVPETDAVSKSMESMIKLDGATLVFPTSFGYFDPFMLDMAKKYPKVEFRHPTSLWDKDKHPPNAGGDLCDLDPAHHLNRIPAGLSTKSHKIEVVAAKPTAPVPRHAHSLLPGV